MFQNPQPLASQLPQLAKQSPLIINLTNDVVKNLSANILLAAGASPIMAHSRRELAELITLCQAVVINIGTLDEQRVARMQFAIEQANLNHKLIILDPVGCGASHYRTNVSKQFCRMAQRLVIRGNASEIMALAGLPSQGQGVDSGDDSLQALEAAQALFHQYSDKALLEISISGATDYILRGSQVDAFFNGHPLMSRVTGMGCSLTALTAAFRSIDESGTLVATALFGVAGELAGHQASGPASFQQHFIDTLYQLCSDNDRRFEETLRWRSQAFTE
ncbi:hydroxyethylthiazole kinase [Celerinatantimonas sp. YJH-8]|uniref:hydroxyethylthiazole kinase n=1 Tax=Celerinatantimonas sp. YJH-8 TaxID=3228714 RepID=UPI0038CB0CC3